MPIFHLKLFIILLISNQNIPDDSIKILLKNAKSSYEEENYIETIVKFKWLIPYLKRCDKAPAYEYLAYSYVKLGDEENAIETFKELLSISPEYEPVEDSVSTDIIEVFQRARKERAHEAGACSCFIPGMGQLLKGEDKKGKIIIFTAGTSFISSIILWFITLNHRDEYLAVEPNNIEEMNQKYKTYKYWFNGALASSAIFLGTYIYSIYDAWSSRTSIKRKKSRVGIEFNAKMNKTYLGFVYKFTR